MSSDTDLDPRLLPLKNVIERQLRSGADLATALEEMKLVAPGSTDDIDAVGKYLRSQMKAIERMRKPLALGSGRRAEWYPGPNENIDIYWPSLERFLLEEKQRPVEVVKSIDHASSKIIGNLDFPGIAEFKTKGLVLGYVQSGKTANFTAVISKAADVGFRAIIILSGLTNALRQQTQDRLQEELVARHSSHWMTWTDQQKDFGDLPMDINAILASDRRHLAVIKKNGPRLRRLLRELRKAEPRILRSCPVLIIDDECDQASVNASGVRSRTTAINGLLRDIIEELPRVCYLGYTATPYANVLIDPSYPNDLYPRDFIVALEMPEQYFGAERLFGRDLLDADDVPPDEQGLDMIRIIPDEEAAAMRVGRDGRHYYTPEILPALRNSILYYWMATAARYARGDAIAHSCMLIHTTVYAAVHRRFLEPIRRFGEYVQAGLARGDSVLDDEMRDLWEYEMSRVDSESLGQVPVSFDELSEHLGTVLEETRVVEENGISDERIDFSIPGRKYIVIGGNVLARGLTIEGLISSYFLRTSSQYDSLMQMGRWFGYRQGYEDLPRIWVTSEMNDYFRDMATVEAEIRHDIEIYDREGITPEQFAIRIRRHPALAITDKKKMVAAVDREVSFSSKHLQTRKFHHTNAEWLENNWDAGSRLLEKASGHDRFGGSAMVFTNVPFTDIFGFLSEYRIHEAHEDMNPERITDYIRSQNNRSDGCLAKWTVAVIAGNKEQQSGRPLGPLGTVKTVVRARLKDLMSDGSADIKALMSKTDITVDMEPIDGVSGMSWDQIKEIRDYTFGQARPMLILYPIDRVSAPSTSGRMPLDAVSDVLGMGIVFPKSRIDTPVGYVSAPIDTSQYEDAEYEEEGEIPE